MLLSSFLWLTLSWCLWNLKIRSLPWSLAGISIVCGLLAQNIVLPALADARSYRPFMQEVNRVIETGQVYLYRSSVAANSLVFYRRGTVPIVEGTPLELAWRLRTSANYFIMEDRAWEAVRQRLGGDHAPLLRSKATGPGGKTRLILVRGIRG